LAGIEKKPQKYDMSSNKKNLIDIIPWEVTQEWYQRMRTHSGSPTELPPGYVDYKLEVPVHFNVGEDNAIVVCLRLAFGKKCPLCEGLFEEWDKDKDKQDDKVINALKPSWRCFYNVFDYDDQEKDIQLWHCAWSNFEEMLMEALEVGEEGLEMFSDPEEGKTVQFLAKEKSIGKNKFNEAHSFTFLKREPYNDDIIDSAVSFDACLVIASYSDIAAMMLHMEDDGEGQEPPNSPDTTRRRRPGGDAQTDLPPDEPAGCPHGGNWGKDCGSIPACQSDCDEKTFRACSIEQDRISKDSVGGPENETPPSENETGSSQNRRQRPGAAPDSADQAPPQTNRRRRRG